MIDRLDNTLSSKSEKDSELDLANDYSLYFSRPEQLLDIFTEMEEKSLPLVQKSQTISETLDEIQMTIKKNLLDENQQVQQLQNRINQFEDMIKNEINRELTCQNRLM